MPRLRTLPPDIGRIILSNIERHKTYLGLTHHDIALAARISDRTLYDRLKQPLKFTLDELTGVANRCKTTVRALTESPGEQGAP